MKVYEGIREGGSAEVTCRDTETNESTPLPPRLDLVRHSPAGFDWGHVGFGPAQLAIAILADHLGEGGEARAFRLQQVFKEKIVARLPYGGWTLTSEEIARVVLELDAWPPEPEQP